MGHPAVSTGNPGDLGKAEGINSRRYLQSLQDCGPSPRGIVRSASSSFSLSCADRNFRFAFDSALGNGRFSSMPEAAYSGDAVHGWRRGMFRRRTDLSWPLIVVLVGLFFLSLRLPRQWERIARPAPLAMKPHNSHQARELQSVAGSRGEISPLEAFRSIQPAGYVASNQEALAGSAASANGEARPAVVVRVAVADSPTADVVSAAAPLEEPVRAGETSSNRETIWPKMPRFLSRAPRRQRTCRFIRRRQRTLLPRPRRRGTKCGSCVMCRRLCLVPALPRRVQLPVRLKFAACRH